MSSNRILTRKIGGLDTRVWLVMLLMVVLSTGLLSYKMMDVETCAPLSVSIKTVLPHNGNFYYDDEILSFAALGNERMLTWDFDDHSPKGEGRYVTHRFMKEGKYYVKITTHGGCETIQTVNIMKSPAAAEEAAGVEKVEKILGHSTSMVGAAENFYSTIKAGSYEWNVLQHPAYLPRTGDSTRYTFTEPGDYTIELTLDNDRSKKYLKTVHVDDVPRPKAQVDEIRQLIPINVQPPRRPDSQKVTPLIDPNLQNNGPANNTKVDPPKKKFMFVSNETFFTFLENVVANQKDISDFNQYLPDGAATKVQTNGDKDFKTFGWLYQEFKGNKKIKMKSVELIRDENENVFNIKVSYTKKKSILGIF